MTRRREPQDRGAGAAVSPWRGTTPELLIAAALVTAAATAGYAMAGWAGLSVVAVATAAIALVVLRALMPRLTPVPAKKARERPRAPMLTGYYRRRHEVQTAMTSRGYYDGQLRPVLEHLLAARLAERHGIHLYADPAAARSVLCRNPRDAGLWRWIDPAARPAGPAQGARDRPAIPRHTLARLINRLEEL